jgi:Asp-tRNA(Asn)/Glu-tRNA(Gln) amidotransferase A subunit family amidase
MGLTSRDGIVPLNLGRDIGGPIARTVVDAVVVFEVIAGHDPADPVTAASLEHPVESYAAALREDALARVRLGVLRAMSDETADPEVIQRFDEAIADLRRLGAVIVDPVALPEPRVQPARTPEGGGPARCSRFRFDLDAYLASLGPDAPVKTLADIVASRQVHPSIRQRLASGLEVDLPPSEQPGCAQQATRDERLRVRVRAVLRDHELDALIFPTWDNPPRLIGDLNSAHGDNSQQLSPPTGFPALSVPMGYVGDGLPVGLQMLGDAWSEQTLFAIAYAYEQGTHHRVAPASTPPMQ